MNDAAGRAAATLLSPAALGGMALALAVATLGTALILRVGASRRLLDQPNERSLHAHAVPRGGGLAVHAGLALGLLPGLAAGHTLAGLGWLAGGWALLAAVSLVDDVRGLPVRLRLPVQIVAASAIVPAGATVAALELPGLGTLALGTLETGFSVLLVLWLTNLYNFMDGMDGFASGMGVLGFGVLAGLAARAGQPALAGVCAVTAAACLGFLPWNFPPARIFLGDVGAVPLGFLAGALSLWGAAHGAWPLWAAVLAFAPFVVDATLTLLKRLLRGERVWQAHREHAYQRLVLAGWGHRRTVLVEYALMAACGASALALVAAPPALQLAGVAAWLVVFAVLYVGVGRLSARVAATAEPGA